MGALAFWRQATRGLRALLHRSAADRDLDDEVRHYLELAAADHAAGGLSPRDARRAAALELGGLTQAREEVRAYGWENAVDATLADFRYAARRLRASPGFTAIAILTLALGIGATTAIWSAVSTVLFRPLPYPDAERITAVWDRAADGARLEVTFGTFREVAQRSHAFDALAVAKLWQPTMTGAAEPERVTGQRVSAAYFRVLGVPPAAGRAFSAVEDRQGGGNVVVLGDAFWRRRFGADPMIIGRTVTLEDDPYLVVGIMPPGFKSALAPDAELWAPLQYEMTQGRAWGHHLRMVGRVRPTVALGDAARELDAIARTPVAEFPRVPWALVEDGFLTLALQDDITRGVRAGLLAILGAVSLVLVIVCVNLTNLMLARGTRRRGELSVRLALGATRGRLLRQLVTEGLLIAAAGGVASTGVAIAMIGIITRLAPAELPRVATVGLDGAAFAFALALTTAIGLTVGALPALQLTRTDPRVDLVQASRRATGGHRRLRGALVVTEVAIALAILTSSGLLLRSLARLLAVPPGFDPSNLLTMQIQSAGHRFDDDQMRMQFFADALEAVQRIPGVASAAMTSQLPLSGDNELYGVHFDPAPADDPGELGGSFRYIVSPNYFATMRIPLRRGRLLDERDRGGAPLVTVISESMARRRLGGVDPIGQRLRIGEGELYTVVGVVGDVRQLSLALDASDAAYTSMAQWHFPTGVMSVVIRGRVTASSLAASARNAVWSVDKDQPIVRVKTMDDLVDASAADRRFVLTLFGAFALVALALAAAGIYGVLSGSVVEREREIGIRAALGASRRRIVALVLGQGLRLTVVGIGLGLAAALASGRAISALLYGVTPADPVTYAGVIGLLALTSVIACAAPAWRAARLDPAMTLRAE